MQITKLSVYIVLIVRDGNKIYDYALVDAKQSPKLVSQHWTERELVWWDNKNPYEWRNIEIYIYIII